MKNLNLEDLAIELDNLRAEAAEAKEDDADPFDEDEQAKLHELNTIEDQLGDLHVYARKMTSELIPEEDFEEYVRDLAEANGDVSRQAHYLVIDWETTAENMKCDYLEIEYDGDTYLVRG